MNKIFALQDEQIRELYDINRERDCVLNDIKISYTEQKSYIFIKDFRGVHCWTVRLLLHKYLGTKIYRLSCIDDPERAAENYLTLQGAIKASIRDIKKSNVISASGNITININY